MKKFNKPIKFFFKKFYDKRGFLLEVFSNKRFGINFNRSVISLSKKNVIRGLHFSLLPEYRLIYVLKGKINDFCVKLTGKLVKKKFTLVENQGLLIPPNYAHGYECLHDKNIIVYYLSWPYSKNNNSGIIWNDETLKLKWKVSKPIISKNDKKLITYLKFKKNAK